VIPEILLERNRRGGVSDAAYERVLRDLACRVPTLHWAVIASVDGVIQATYDPFGRERADRLLALVSSVLTLGERVFQKLQHGRLECLTLAGKTGVIVACPVGPAYVMAISTPPEAQAAAVYALEQVVNGLRPALSRRGVGR
jgi:predicted regulator of Ras-like GTPase activity (Roadblock/LC7/MglB family)